MSFYGNQMDYPKYQRRERESRRRNARPYWRDDKKRQWENRPNREASMARPGMRPFIHPPMNNNAYRPPVSNYQVESFSRNVDQNRQSAYAAPNRGISQMSTALDIHGLFQQLVTAGLVPSPAMPDTKPIERDPLETLRAVSFSNPASLKVRHNQLYEMLYPPGMQCGNCSMRFPPEQSEKYGQHLDWHFRQNSKRKKNKGVASRRGWYYPLSDWKNYEEIEYVEERPMNYFDQQQLQLKSGSVSEEIEIPSVPSIPGVVNAQCVDCGDKFDEFFNDDKEEWHLRNAIRVDNKTYHPGCYEEDSTKEHDGSPTELEEEEAEKGTNDEVAVIDDDEDDSRMSW